MEIVNKRSELQTTKEIIRNIGKIFEKGLEDDYLSRSIRKVIEYEKEKTLHDIRALREDLDKYENKYKISTGDFSSKFVKGEVGDDEDYFELSAIWQMYERSIERVKLLEGAS